MGLVVLIFEEVTTPQSQLAQIGPSRHEPRMRPIQKEIAGTEKEMSSWKMMLQTTSLHFKWEIQNHRSYVNCRSGKAWRLYQRRIQLWEND
ncbi:hypothetical protein ASPU41_04080 [Arthrobacter sp. U41]|nr:hypothetical protein ASPU41_04080 [Arthrobacter sp. U41]